MYTYFLSILSIYSQSLYKSQYHFSSGKGKDYLTAFLYFLWTIHREWESTPSRNSPIYMPVSSTVWKKCHMLPDVSFSSKFYNFSIFIFSDVIFKTPKQKEQP